MRLGAIHGYSDDHQPCVGAKWLGRRHFVQGTLVWHEGRGCSQRGPVQLTLCDLERWFLSFEDEERRIITAFEEFLRRGTLWSLRPQEDRVSVSVSIALAPMVCAVPFYELVP